MADVVEVDASTGVTVERAFTEEERAQRAIDSAAAAAATVATNSARLNRATLETLARNALAGNRAAIAATSPTNAQVVGQVKELSKQNNALIRIVLDLLDATD